MLGVSMPVTKLGILPKHQPSANSGGDYLRKFKFHRNGGPCRGAETQSLLRKNSPPLRLCVTYFPACSIGCSELLIAW